MKNEPSRKAEPVAWKAYEEVDFNDQYILRWVREGDEYVNKITKEMMEDLQAVVHKQYSEIEALKAAIISENEACAQILLDFYDTTEPLDSYDTTEPYESISPDWLLTLVDLIDDRVGRVRTWTINQ
jgi:hypothetical protein